MFFSQQQFLSALVLLQFFLSVLDNLQVQRPYGTSGWAWCVASEEDEEIFSSLEKVVVAGGGGPQERGSTTTSSPGGSTTSSAPPAPHDVKEHLQAQDHAQETSSSSSKLQSEDSAAPPPLTFSELCARVNFYKSSNSGSRTPSGRNKIHKNYDSGRGKNEFERTFEFGNEDDAELEDDEDEPPLFYHARVRIQNIVQLAGRIN
ncbi:unnamed protein product, partial [Amoebophrya sp. A120]|eukprot:GSA120T00007203001.1